MDRSKLKAKPILIIVLVLLIGLAVLVWLGQRSDKSKPYDIPAIVQLNKDSFVPATLNIEPGTTVEWVNRDSVAHRLASNPHPEHSDLPGLDSKQAIPPGGTYRYTFTDTGNFGYHEHEHPTTNGIIQVNKR